MYEQLQVKLNFFFFSEQGKKSSTQSAKPKDPILLKFNINNEVTQMVTTAKTNLNR